MGEHGCPSKDYFRLALLKPKSHFIISSTAVVSVYQAHPEGLLKHS